MGRSMAVCPDPSSPPRPRAAIRWRERVGNTILAFNHSFICGVREKRGAGLTPYFRDYIFYRKAIVLGSCSYLSYNSFASSQASYPLVTPVMAVAPPSVKAHPFIAAAGELVYLWGGKENTETETIFIYRHDNQTWTRRLTTGSHPPTGLCSGGCAISGQCLYIYGGTDILKRYRGDLYELNTKSWRWKIIVGVNAAGGPGEKAGCRMISHQGLLLIIGGYYDKTPRLRQAGASYENGRTNEIHSYNPTTGKR